MTREQLIELCQDAVVHHTKWSDRDSYSAQKGIQSIYEGLTAGLDFTLKKREKVIEISKIIAQLDGSNTIEPQHIAEAIQYNYYYDNTRCNAENKSINFGDGIQIALYDLDYTDIENAINYLSGLVKK